MKNYGVSKPPNLKRAVGMSSVLTRKVGHILDSSGLISLGWRGNLVGDARATVSFSGAMDLSCAVIEEEA